MKYTTFEVFLQRKWEDETECNEVNWKLSIKYNTSTLPWLLINV